MQSVPSNPKLNFDYGPSSISISFNSSSITASGTFNGPVFSDLNGTIPDITAVTLNAATNMVGLDASRISFDANTVRINWQGLSFDTSTVVMLDLGFANVAPTPAIAVPALSEWSLLLLMLAVMGLGLAPRRRLDG